MKRSKIIVCMILIILAISVLGTNGCSQDDKSSKKESSQKSVSTGKKVSIPTKILDNKFGFLSGAPEEAGRMKELGGLWGRPHPGPFLWDSMQKGKNEDISFSKTDMLVEKYQEEGVGVLVTLWPFADWDQKEKPNASSYMVSENDEFLPKGPEGSPGEIDYLPRYRSNPYDWEAYQTWIKKVVERYDGDGKDDMPGLKIPIKFWEVMNEPDLTSPEGEEDSRLDFYKEDAIAYRELLIKTSEAIREADPEAKVLIAGAAGGSDPFLNFYREVLKDQNAVAAFDIGNVHCISNDDYDSFNVAPYNQMLQEMGIDKPVWVTEAEAVLSDDQNINATQTLYSTRKALELGAQRIFFTRQDFRGEKKPPGPGGKPQTVTPEINGSDPKAAYKEITS